MKPAVRHLWLLLHALVVLVPGAGMIFRPRPIVLYGVEDPAPKPLLSLRGWIDESVQRAARAWFESHVAYRGAMIKADNTAQLALLREAKPGGPVILTNRESLLPADDLEHGSLRPVDMPDTRPIDELASLVGRVQRKIESHGKRFAVVIAPAKTSIYDFDLPDRWRRRTPGPRVDDALYDMLIAALRREGVRYASAREQMRVDGAARDIYYPRTARHWSRLGACRPLAEALADTPFAPRCELHLTGSNGAYDVDYDLYFLLNSWYWHGVLPEIPKPGEQHERVEKSRALFVGSSFSWVIVDVMRPLVRDPLFFYYDKTAYDVSVKPARRLGSVDASAPEWRAEVLDRDLYVFEILETYMLHDYLRTFLRELDAAVGP